jgi:prepilin-type processing-associated H-X9-DG protein
VATLYWHSEQFISPAPCSASSARSAKASSIRSRDPGGANFLFGDGSVHLVSQGITPSAWIALGTRAGGEVIADSGF